MAKLSRKPAESVSSSYTPLVHAVLDSVALMGASHTARSLLLELMRQHTGGNNGHLHLAQGWLRKRGWKSGDTIQRAKLELIKRNLIVQTKQGGLNIGPCRFALTWLPITNFVGLELRASEYHKGAWHFMDELPQPQKHKGSSVSRIGASPPHGSAKRRASPPDGSKTALLGNVASPPDGNNECLPLPPRRTIAAVVGKKGKSGIKKVVTATTPAIGESVH
ncbi:MAG: hypothetical protein Q7T59_05060 [Candidatus Woesebacteria bacterium]|nr:hypothetical protein [Candidatus Woesebacteria bacterium]